MGFHVDFLFCLILLDLGLFGIFVFWGVWYTVGTKQKPDTLVMTAGVCSRRRHHQARQLFANGGLCEGLCSIELRSSIEGALRRQRNVAGSSQSSDNISR